MTLESCAAFCAAYRYFGAEYSGECYCGDALAAGSANASSAADCSLTCSGDATEYCGGPSRLELYEQQGVVAPAGPAQPASVTSDKGTKWAFYQCRTEATGVRALSGDSYAADSVTLEACAKFCDGWAYFGAEYGRECYCGNGFGAGSVQAAAADCSMPCAGNGGELCGNGNRLSVYAKAA